MERSFPHVLLPTLAVASLLSGCVASSTAGRNDVWREMKTVVRTAPSPSPEHPGNVFLLGEKVTIAAPSETAKWRITDDGNKKVTEGTGNTVDAGELGIGWYRIAFLDAQDKESGYTTAAVLAPLAAPTPQDSPVCVDSASAWFGRADPAKQERFAYLATLAGANWIRDRMSWGDMEPQKGSFSENTTYDSSAEIVSRHGLKSLQVFHGIPQWAVNPQLDGESARGRFPRDLRDHYAFCRAMAERYKGRVQAWEPWNEANIPDFGGHTIDEICSLQKAAYWGLKAGDPGVVVCWNVFAGGGNKQESEGVIRNEAWPYFETYNVHTYDPPEKYLGVFERARNAASGRPVWLSECGIGLHFIEDSKEGELTPELEYRQAAFIARSYASSLYAGVNRHFFFILGNYLERVNQFGLLRYDQSPRPGYVALAAVGRLLAGAKCVGRVAPVNEDGPYVYVFRAYPGAVERDVLVAWSLKSMDNPLPTDLKVEMVCDYLGRPCPRPARLNEAAAFLVLPAGESRRLRLEPLPPISAYREGAPSPVVLQLVMPSSASDLGHQAHKIVPGQKTDATVAAYNFSNQKVSGTLRMDEIPGNVRASIGPETVQMDPFERKELPLTLAVPNPEQKAEGWVTLRGDFGAAGRPVLAFRLIVKDN